VVKPSPGRPDGLDETIDFDRFFAWLDSLTVPLPEPDGSTPVPSSVIASLLPRVQNRRADATRAALVLERRAGESKRKIDVLTEQRRLEKAEIESDQRYRRLRRADLDATVAAATGEVSAMIAQEKAAKDRIDAALRAAKVQIDTLETAKQTLNALARIAEENEPYLNHRRRMNG
jgi:hypothetical protein